MFIWAPNIKRTVHIWMILTPTDWRSIHSQSFNFFFLVFIPFLADNATEQSDKAFPTQTTDDSFSMPKLLKIEINLLKPKLLILLLILLHPKRTIFVSISFVFETFGTNSPSENYKPQVSLLYMYKFHRVYIISEKKEIAL